MKKMLAVVLSLVAVFVLGTAVVFAAKHHNSAQVTTIADIKANGRTTCISRWRIH